MEKDYNCDKCGTDDWTKKGKSDNGQQRYKCKNCGYRSLLKDDIEDTDTDTKTNQYQSPIQMSAFDEDHKIMDIDMYCVFYNLPRGDIRSYKLVTHTGTPYYNIAFHEKAEELSFLNQEFFASIVKKYIVPVKYNVQYSPLEGNVIRTIITDAHIGMHPDKEGISIYGGTWNKEEQISRFMHVVNNIIHTSEEGDMLIIDDLGDYLDGWDGQTVRKGHDLPQNMTNEEMFDQGVYLKVTACDLLVSSNRFSSIRLNNVVNNNHSGPFDYVVNSAVKSILETKYPDLVTVTNYKKFLNYYKLGEHTFIISHGKDKENLKFGFKPVLDPNAEKKISNYIRENDLSGYIEFSKGDSHQCLFDMCTSDLFDYMNYPSLAPASQWVQTNFQKGRSGYVIQVFNKNEKDKVILPKFF